MGTGPAALAFEAASRVLLSALARRGGAAHQKLHNRKFLMVWGLHKRILPLPASQRGKGEFFKLAQMSAVIVFVALSANLKEAQAVNKCIGADGKVTFQDAPCAGNGEKMDVRPGSGHLAPAAAGEAQRRLEKLKSDNLMSEAIRTRKPLVGMTAAQLQEAMGAPTKVNADNYNGAQREQQIYERPQETWFVYTRSGLVESIQHRPGIPVFNPSARTTGPCPAQPDIRNAITSASSMMLSDAERVERWKSITAMQACGK